MSDCTLIIQVGQAQTSIFFTSGINAIPIRQSATTIVVPKLRGKKREDDIPPPVLPSLWLEFSPPTSAFPSWIPPADLSITCLLNLAKISLFLHRVGTGRYAGLNVPTVCAHSPVPGPAGPVLPTSTGLLPCTALVAPSGPAPAPSAVSRDVGDGS